MHIMKQQTPQSRRSCSQSADEQTNARQMRRRWRGAETRRDSVHCSQSQDSSETH